MENTESIVVYMVDGSYLPKTSQEVDEEMEQIVFSIEQFMSN